MLDLGDIQIGSDFLVIERKTLADLCASIKDGRYHNQKHALMHSSFQIIMYIIESTEELMSPAFKSEYHHGVLGRAIVSCILNMMMRDRIHVMISRGVQETAQIIREIWKRVSEHPEKYITSKQRVDSTDTLVNPKASRRDSVFIRQLCQIPGISRKTALRIATVYPSFQELCHALRDLSTEERLIRLQEIKSEDGRKLNKPSIDGIIAAFF